MNFIKIFSSIFFIAFYLNASETLLPNNYLIFDDKNCLLNKNEISELDTIIEMIGKNNNYANGNGGFSGYNYGYIFYMVTKGVNSRFQVNLIKSTDATNENTSEAKIIKSIVDEKIAKSPIICTLVKNVVTRLPDLKPDRIYVLEIQLIYCAQEDHKGMHLHQDGAAYLFTLITKCQDINGGDMCLYRLNAGARTSLENSIYKGDKAALIKQWRPYPGSGYFIKESPNSLKEESNFCPIVHSHTTWTKNGANPRRNLVVIEVSHAHVVEGELQTREYGED